MTDLQLSTAFAEAPHYTDPDAYVSELLLSAAFLPPEDPDAQPDLTLDAPLRRIWRTVNAPFREFLADLGLRQTELARRYDIPLRTVQRWAAGDTECATYIRRMIAELAGYAPRTQGNKKKEEHTMKPWKQALVDEIVRRADSDRIISLREVAAESGIDHIARQDVGDIMRAVLARRPDYRAVRMERNPHDSLFQSLTFLDRVLSFDDDGLSED